MKLRHFSMTPLVNWKDWVQEEGYVHDGSGDTMEVQEGDRADCSGDRTESGQVYIYIS